MVNSPNLDSVLGCEAHLKCEQLQGMGAFKIRGAMNAVLCLREAGINGAVATHSSGNHGAALAAAARDDGRLATIVMPENALPSKIENVRRHGGEIQFCDATQRAREEGLASLIAGGHIAVHPYDQFEVIAGQGTVAIEMFQQGPELDILLIPIGGGGLAAGCALVANELSPATRVIAAEPAGAADTAESLELGRRIQQFKPDTIADGLRALLGATNFLVLKEHLDRVITVSEAGILNAMKLLETQLDMRIEPSSATAIAAIQESPAVFKGQRVGIVITGGNS